MMVYGSDRVTADLDVVSTKPLSLTPKKHLSFGGFTTLTSEGCPVDVVVRDDDYRALYEEALEEARDEGLPLPVVTPEHLAAMKMAAGRDKDMGDPRTLIHLKVVDVAKVRSIVKKHLGPYAARELDNLVDEVAWEDSREK